MEVILLERVANLGQIGDIVRVKDGFARNYLLRKGKALRATKENRSRFEKMRVELEARNLEQKEEAEKIAQKLDGLPAVRTSSSRARRSKRPQQRRRRPSLSRRGSRRAARARPPSKHRTQKLKRRQNSVECVSSGRWRLGIIPQTRQQQVAGPASLPQLPAGRPPRRLPAQDRPGDCPLPRSRTVAEA